MYIRSVEFVVGLSFIESLLRKVEIHSNEYKGKHTKMGVMSDES